MHIGKTVARTVAGSIISVSIFSFIVFSEQASHFLVGIHEVCAAHGGCSNGHNGGAGDGREGGGGGDGGGGGRNPPPPPRPCVVTLDRTLVASGTPTVSLSWSPPPGGRVNLRRGRDRLTVPDRATSFTDSIASLRSGRYTYSLSYTVPGVRRSRDGGGGGGDGGATGDGTRGDAGTPDTAFEEMLEFVFSLTTPVYADHGGTADGESSRNHGGGDSGNNDNNDGGTDYACIVTLTIVDRITECNDTIDNADTEDAFADTRDPGCHSDGNPNNSRSYVSLDPSEANGPPDLRPFISSATTGSTRRPIRVTAGVENLAPIYAASNALVYGWRNTAGGGINCGRRGRNCFVEDGKTYLRLNTFTRAYNGLQRRTDNARTFRPLDIGRYEVCAVADFTNVIFEGVAGEANNSTCKIIEVDDDPDTPDDDDDDTSISGPPTISATPNRIRRDTTVLISWDTGGRVDCTITGTNGEVIDVSETASTGSQQTIAITAATTYAMTCTDDNSRVETTIRLIPQYQEI